jgi:D-alanine-D-alanine ligase
MYSSLPSSLRIGVLRGGPSPEYDVSLKSGAHVLKHLSETHRPVDIFISRDGTWHMQGVERSPEKILPHVDVVFNTLYGSYGEDGGVQEVLSSHGVPHTSSERFSSVLTNNKFLTKQHAKEFGVKTPLFFLVRGDEDIPTKAKEIFTSIPHPLVVKPTFGSSFSKFFIIESFPELLSSLENVLSLYPSALVEEYISGKPISSFIVDNFRNQNTYTFPLIEKFSEEEVSTILNVSKKIHDTLKLSHFSKSDFIVSPRRGVYFLEINTTPKLHDDSPLLHSLESVGVSVKEFLHHLISLALTKG